MTEADTQKRRRGGGGNARRATRSAVSFETAKYIERNIPNFEILTPEALEIIEANAETVLAEIGVNFIDNPKAIERWREAGAEIVRAFKQASATPARAARTGRSAMRRGSASWAKTSASVRSAMASALPPPPALPPLPPAASIPVGHRLSPPSPPSPPLPAVPPVAVVVEPVPPRPPDVVAPAAPPVAAPPAPLAKRDDDAWLRHTVAHKDDDGRPVLDYKDVDIDDVLRLIAEVGFQPQSLPFEHGEFEPGSSEVFLGSRPLA